MNGADHLAKVGVTARWGGAAFGCRAQGHAFCKVYRLYLSYTSEKMEKKNDSPKEMRASFENPSYFAY